MATVYKVTLTPTLDDDQPPSVPDVTETLEQRYNAWGYEVAVEDITPDEDRYATHQP